MKSSHSIKNSIFPASKSRRSQSRQVSFHPSIPLSILAMLSLPASATIVLLDNTAGLTRTDLSAANQTGWGSNSSAYNRINGYTFEVGSTSYDATAITIALRYGVGSITPNMRISFWELPSLSASAPAANAVPFYTQDNASNTINATAQYFTYERHIESEGQHALFDRNHDESNDEFRFSQLVRVQPDCSGSIRCAWSNDG